MQIIEAIKNAVGGRTEMPAGDAYPSTWFSRKDLAYGLLHGQIAEMRRNRAPVPAEMLARFDALTAEIEAAREHNAKIEARHAHECNAVKAKMRRAAGVRAVMDEDF